MAKNPDKDFETTKRLMGALVRMPPKLHDEMKLGKTKGKPAKSPRAKRASRASSANAKTS